METSTNSHYVAGMAYFDQKNFPLAAQEFKKAINDEPQNARFWTRLGWTFLELDQNREAINTLTSAIQIDPKHENAYWWRANAYENLHEYDLCLYDRSTFFAIKTDAAKEFKGEKPNLNYKLIHTYIVQNILPSLVANGDSQVWYTPCKLRWGRKKEDYLISGSSFSRSKVFCGTGFCLVSRKSVIFYSGAGFTQNDSYWKPSVGLRILDSLSHDHEEEVKEKEDKIWKLAHTTLTGITNDKYWIYLNTKGINFEIFTEFSDEQDLMSNALSMCMNGAFAGPPALPSVQPISASEDVMKLLQQLGDLKTQGILTEAEFEQKKKELLARL